MAIIAIAVFVISPYFLPAKVLAQGGLEETAGAAGLPTNTNIVKIIGQVIYIILGFLGIVFIILIIYGGFMRMTATGNSEQIKKSTNIILSAVIGVIIILASYSITAFILSRVETSVGGSSGGESYNFIQSGSCVEKIIYNEENGGGSISDCQDNETIESCSQKCAGMSSDTKSHTCTWSKETCP